MNLQNLIVLTVIFTLMLLAMQRTERKRLWMTALLMLLPGGYLIYRWAIYRGQIKETLVALSIGVVLNGLFWLLYGRVHPPASSDEIQVYGMDD